ncbi:MAG TPA: LysR family transcriptional regulator [Clostridiaceae bacterium]|nr:LysR family transcriptional regulator [Clostridiaceae bacterium]
MLLKLDLYRIFCEVASCRSFSKAAKALFMTQPAVSQSISQLENILGTRLFTRTPKGVTLTREGQLVYEYARSAINFLETGEEKLKEIQGLITGELRIGVSDTTAKFFLVPYLDQFHKLYSNIKLNIINGTSVELCELLKAGHIDLAICNLPVEDPAIHSIPCMTVHDIFVAGTAYKDKITHPLSLEELTQLPLIFLEQKSNSRRYVERFFLGKGIRLNPEIELGSHDLLILLAKINLGISCVIKEYTQAEIETGTLFEVPLKEQIPDRSIGLCYLKRVLMSPSAQKFSSLILNP